MFEHKELVDKLNEEKFPKPQPHPLANRMVWTIFWFYCLSIAMIIGFVLGLLLEFK